MLLVASIAIFAILGIISFMGSRASLQYHAATVDEMSAAVMSPYDEMDRVLDGFSAGLEAANRQKAARLSGKRYFNLTSAECVEADYLCGVDEVQFLDPLGCGCVPAEQLLDESDEPQGVSDKAEEEAVVESVRLISLGEEVRMGLDEVWALGQGGDVIWLEEFSDQGGRLPELRFSVYIAAEDRTYTLPEEGALLLYRIEPLATDYESYVQLVVRNLLEGDTFDEDGLGS